MRRPIFCALILLAFALVGCGSKTDSGNARPGNDTPTKSAAAARAELMETAKKMEGPMSDAVKAYVEAVESGTWSWSQADREFAPGKFTPETIAAYKRWRTAKLAETKK